ncbi:VOC family protein [Actinomycetaceae bacterium L2_0104]
MAPQDRLAEATRMGTVLLEVRDLENMMRFYHLIVGLDILEESSGTVALGRRARPMHTGAVEAEAAQAKPSWITVADPGGDARSAAGGGASTAGNSLEESAVVVLRENKNLPLRSEGSAGLFHTAILFQNPRELAAAVIRISRSVPQLFTGTGDHNVSQAFYLDDPEGNGVELYVDRPRETWSWIEGSIYMTTEYIDPAQFVADNMPGVSQQTRQGGNDVGLGHVHLQVGDVDSAHRFYVETLGFEQTARMGRSALFVSAGGYHHHMAMNTWGSAGAGPRVPSLGLGRVDIVVPNRAEVESVTDRLVHGGFAVRDDGRTVETSDPWGNTVRLTGVAVP